MSTAQIFVKNAQKYNEEIGKFVQIAQKNQGEIGDGHSGPSASNKF